MLVWFFAKPGRIWSQKSAITIQPVNMITIGGILGVYSTVVSVPNGKSAPGFKKPGSVGLKLLTAEKGSRRPFNK